MSGPHPDGTRPVNRWLAETGGTRGPAYARRFAALAASGEHVHGEADFVDALLAPGSAVLDAGCGTGRVGVELARRGHRVTGVDLDASMLEQARAAAPHLRWLLADLLEVDDEAAGAPLDAAVLAGNVVVYLTEGTEARVVRRVAGWLRPGGLLVAGFAADRHVGPDQYARWCAAADLEPVSSHTAWDAAAPPPGPGAPYAVVVHRRPHGDEGGDAPPLR
ncbi:bifunctional 2-polyprenyl-6-hydroxyphenol methylase/3-demethylubiquinol 3-O-methyltransferase UbiG [Quadrisphaera sp. DSM 44207]|uniref:class I SAM-dependent methyltransferase n=1 Tax=Quadrisphaera sp. DSM 44207 TaxID=1881057 RepID=UPI0008895BB5|nr:class I SAM-dependent methyltransferase [Quadrisphaera sp. DSM 44207]SDQ69869.1 Methyltransferase domain-containing protein [Quadrisphaera sp. DSM 44207]